MKNTLLIILLILLAIIVPAQTSKPAKMPPAGANQVDMDDAMKQLQDIMKSLPPEAKQVMDSLGINEKLSNGTLDLKAQGVTDKQIKDAVDNENRLVPVRNEALIMLSGKRLKNESELKSFLDNWCISIRKRLDPKSITRFEALASEMKTRGNGNDTTYTLIASMLMLADRPNLAMAAFTEEFLKKGIHDYNDLNNFSVLCNSMGGPQVALPVLNFMNTFSPDNPVILNNIGQAWYTCGEKDSAELFLNKSIRILAYNPEANETISKIFKEEGKDKEAEEAMKRSIKAAYSPEKEELAKKLGITITKDDYNLPPPLPYDPLGFLKIQIPELQKNMNDYYKSYPPYLAWRAAIEEELSTLKTKYNSLENQKENIVADEENFNSQALQSHSIQNGMGKAVNQTPVSIKMRSYLEKNPEKLPAALLIESQKRLREIDNDYEEHKDEIEKKASKIIGSNQCFLNSLNFEIGEINREATSRMIKHINEITRFRTEELYYRMFTESDEVFELIKTDAKIKFLEDLLSTPHMFVEPGCKLKLPTDSLTLAKWEDEPSHCNITPIGFKDPLEIIDFQWDCNGSHLIIDSPMIKFKDASDGSGNTIGNGSFWIGLTAGKSIYDQGIAKVGAKVTVGAYFEFNKGGLFDNITDCGITIGGELKSGLNLQNLGVPKDANGNNVEGPTTNRNITAVNAVEIIKIIDKNANDAIAIKNGSTKESVYFAKNPLAMPSFKVGSEAKLSWMDSGKNTVTAKASGDIFGNGIEIKSH